jgi:hypothetical protein
LNTHCHNTTVGLVRFRLLFTRLLSLELISS